MPQLVTRVDDALLAEVDRLVETGLAESRSDAVRTALAEFIDVARRREVDRAIVEEYRRLPQRDEEVGWSDEATLQMIREEPW